MAIITRLTRLFRADVHAVLDRMEEPDVLLRQAIREMEEEVAQNAQHLKARELDRQQTQGRMDAIEASRKDIAEQLDLCFAVQNEALARTLLRRRLEGERLIKHLGQRLTGLQQVFAERSSQLDENRRRLEAMRQKAELFDTEAVRAQGTDAGRGSSAECAISDADVDLALLREQQQRRTS